MNLREKVVKGFVNSYLRSERNLVVRLLRTGRMTEQEWNKKSKELNKQAKKFKDQEITAEEFINQRKQIEKEIKEGEKTKKKGTTKEKAETLYEEYRQEHEEALKECFQKTKHSTLYFLFKTPIIKANYHIYRLKYN